MLRSFLIGCLCLTNIAIAQNFTVTGTADAVDANPGDGVCDDGSGTCTLRAAIIESNALGGPHTITLPANTYTLTLAGAQENGALTGDLDISSDVTIVGASPQTTFINADSLDRVFHILSGATASFTLIDINEGYVVSENGGGILNEGTLTISYSIIENNDAVLANGVQLSQGFGGGIANNGTLNMNNTTINGNVSLGGRGINGLNGGGGGGSTPGLGGGIFNDNGATITMENITVSGNIAHGGRHSSGSVNAGNWNFDGRDGAGLLFGVGGASGGGTGGNGGEFSGGGGGGSQPSGGGLGGNGGFGAGGGGGGASAGGGNGGTGGTGGHGGGPGGMPCCSYGGGGGAGAGMGGGLFNNGGTVTMNSTTIAFNEAFGGSGASGWGGWAWGGGSGDGVGGGIYNRSGTVDLSNTIVSNNALHNNVLDNDPIGAISNGDLEGTFASTDGHNLVLEPGISVIGGNTTGNILNTDPGLAPLAFNGGETTTHEITPCPASPAINAADQATAAPLDQRDFARNGTPDIGAYEGDPSQITLAVTNIVQPCTGDSTGEIAVLADNGIAPYTYQWDANANNQINDTAVGLAGGTYTVTVTDDNNCIKDTTITLISLPTPIVDLGNDTTLCQGASILLDAGNPGSTYLWQDGSTAQQLSTSTAGICTVEVTNTDGCTASDTIDIAVELLPIAGSDSSLIMCNSSDPLDMNTMLDAGITGGIWSETSVTPSQQFNTGSGMLGMTSTMSGTYTFNYMVPGTFCPNDTSQMIVNVSVQPDAGNDNGTAICNTDAALDLNGMLDAGVSPGVWQETSTVVSGQFDEGTGSLDPTDLPSGTYTFAYITDEVVPCPQDTSLFTVNITATPRISFFVTPTEGCEPLDVGFVNESIAGANATCFWDLGDGATSSNCALDSHTYVVPGCYDVTLTMTENGCTASNTITDAVCVHPNPIANFSWLESQIFSDDPTVNFVNASTTANSYAWNFGDGGTSSVTNPTHTFPIGVNANYTVTLLATNEFGCTDSISKVVPISEIILFYVPNAFTPDGDEHNNVFGPVMGTGFDAADFQFEIYNRWGEKIFESFDVNGRWDGTFQGTLVQPGTYTWKLTFGDLYNDERHMHVGSVSILH